MATMLFGERNGNSSNNRYHNDKQKRGLAGTKVAGTTETGLKVWRAGEQHNIKTSRGGKRKAQTSPVGRPPSFPTDVIRGRLSSSIIGALNVVWGSK